MPLPFVTGGGVLSTPTRGGATRGGGSLLRSVSPLLTPAPSAPAARYHILVLLVRAPLGHPFPFLVRYMCGWTRSWAAGAGMHPASTAALCGLSISSTVSTLHLAAHPQVFCGSAPLPWLKDNRCEIYTFLQLAAF
ncbi:unnamed protein product [Miscanthus lutarioriparius]|uniref:Uncharacterized protein n=1 Tax=Miscanthus lutarioriparius TaxID=422564 RepID=A0A811QKB8_9POAL|nr:unnamed protein product [Miscanthus lutarioriparius]